MSTGMPLSFWLYFAGAVLCGGLAMWMAFRILSRVRLRERLRAAAADARGSAAVETMFALIVFITITIYGWQFTFICAAYQVVDYAAYAACRSAIVIIPPDLSEKGGKKANEVEPDFSGPSGSIYEDLETVPKSTAGVKELLKNKAMDLKCSIMGYELYNKRRDIVESAQWVCYPISGFKKFDGIDLGVDLGGTFNFSAGTTLHAPPFLEDFLNKGFLKRYFYTKAHTRLAFVPDETDFADAKTVTVSVTHDFHLGVPFASLLFRNGFDEKDGSYKTLTSTTTLPFDPGEEFPPNEAPPDADGLASKKK